MEKHFKDIFTNGSSEIKNGRGISQYLFDKVRIQ